MSRVAIAGLMVAGVLAAPASATESTIVPGVGIGKLKLGMTLAQAERALGKDHLVNDSGTVGGRRFVDYGWNFSSWSATFVQQSKTRRLVQVATTLRAQRTVGGIGIGSRFEAVARAYPTAACGAYQTQIGPEDRRYAYPALVVPGSGTQTVFLVHPADPTAYDLRTVPWVVYGVLVRSLVQGSSNLVDHCQPGWRLRGRP